MSSSNQLFIRFVPVLFVLLWSTGFIGAKYALPYMEPYYLLFIRALLTVFVFFGLFLLMRSRMPTKTQAFHQIVVGILIHGCYLGGVFTAIKWDLPAGVTAIVVGLQPLLTALLGWRWLGERLRSQQWFGLVLGLLGVSGVLLGSMQGNSFEMRPEALAAALLALTGISIGTLYQKHYGAGTPLLGGSVFQFFALALLMAVLAFSFEEREIIWDTTLVLSMVWLVFGLSVSAVLLLMYMIREGEMARVASYFYLVPPVTAVEAWLLFGETLTTLQIVAITVTVVGVFLVIREPSKKV